MTALLDVFHDVLHQPAVHLDRLVAPGILSILLDGPDGPQGHVGLLHLVDLHRQRLPGHELAQTLLRRLHHQLEVVLLVDGQRQARQGDERVPRAALEPRVAGQQVACVVGLAVVELVGSGHQTVVEVVARHAKADLLVEQLLQLTRLRLARRGGEHDALALLDAHLEVAGNIQVLVRGVAALLLLRIFYATVPVGLEHKRVLLRELHVQVGIALVHARLDAAVNLLVLTARHHVLVRELAHRAEGQERAEAKRRSRVGILQRVADEDAVLVGLENRLALQNHTTHAVRRRRNKARVELTDVLVSFRTEVVALILVEAKVELRTMLDDRAVERRQQHVVLVVKLGHGHYKQTVVLARVAVNQRRCTVRTTTVRAKQLAAKALFKVRHHGFFKSQITHSYSSGFFIRFGC